MSNGFPAILTPQLSEQCSELNITTNQKALIISMDNIVAPFAAISGGILQQKVGPKKILFLCRDLNDTRFMVIKSIVKELPLVITMKA